MQGIYFYKEGEIFISVKHSIELVLDRIKIYAFPHIFLFLSFHFRFLRIFVLFQRVVIKASYIVAACFVSFFVEILKYEQRIDTIFLFPLFRSFRLEIRATINRLTLTIVYLLRVSC